MSSKATTKRAAPAPAATDDPSESLLLFKGGPSLHSSDRSTSTHVKRGGARSAGRGGTGGIPSLHSQHVGLPTCESIDLCSPCALRRAGPSVVFPLVITQRQ